MKQEKLRKIKINISSFTLFLVIFLITLGALFQVISEFIDNRSYTQSGKMYDMDGYKLHLNCTGTGNVTIILESDFQFPSLQWDPVQRELAKYTQVCSYDRSGLGWSEKSPIARESQLVIEEEYKLLRKGNIENPLIIVGNGNATLITRLFANRYPENILGIVLINPTLEHNNDQTDHTFFGSSAYTNLKYQSATLATWLGITRMRGYLGLLPEFQMPISGQPLDFQRKFLSMTAYRTDYWSAAHNDILSLNDFRLELDKNKEIKDKPLSILIDQKGLERSGIEDNSQKTNENLLYLETISKNFSLEYCTDCGVMPPLTNPGAVVSIIKKMYNQVQP